MPFLRIIRDKRGYETTYLMHWYREGHRQRSKILYVFRTPGGVRVGRNALEPEVLRSIEAQYPDIEFDWKAVVDNQQVVEPAVDYRQLRKQRRRPDEEGGAPAARPAPPAVPAPAGAESGSPAPQPRPAFPAVLQGTTPDEHIAFLTTLYPTVRERIPHRTVDPARQEALLALAERLNPATWTDADQIAAGLVQASEALERLSHVFSKRRRRSRRSPKPSAPQSSADTLDVTPSAPAAEPEPESEPEPEPELEPEPEPDTPSDQ